MRAFLPAAASDAASDDDADALAASIDAAGDGRGTTSGAETAFAAFAAAVALAARFVGLISRPRCTLDGGVPVARNEKASSSSTLPGPRCAAAEMDMTAGELGTEPDERPERPPGIGSALDAFCCLRSISLPVAQGSSQLKVI